MAKETVKHGRTLYVCEACGFAYEQKEWAEKCQEWCQEHQSCKLEIACHAVPVEPEIKHERIEAGGALCQLLKS